MGSISNENNKNNEQKENKCYQSTTKKKVLPMEDSNWRSMHQLERLYRPSSGACYIQLQHYLLTRHIHTTRLTKHNNFLGLVVLFSMKFIYSFFKNRLILVTVVVDDKCIPEILCARQEYVLERQH